MNVSSPKLVEIYRAKNAPEAHVIRMALEEAGVAAHIDAEELQSVVGEIPGGWVTAPRIQVEESQASLARKIIHQAQAHIQPEQLENEPREVTRCLSCGQVMAESDDKCSSCGWTFLAEETAEQI